MSKREINVLFGTGGRHCKLKIKKSLLVKDLIKRACEKLDLDIFEIKCVKSGRDEFKLTESLDVLPERVVLQRHVKVNFIS